MSTQKKSEEQVFDLRTLEYHLSKGELKKAEYDKFLGKLPDQEGNYENSVIEEDIIDIDEELDENE